jgi:hypothetical protein
MVLVEPLHGLNFALAHLTCVTAIGRVAPPGMAATAQAFYGTVALARRARRRRWAPARSTAGWGFGVLGHGAASQPCR